jgi:hypothetical protein
MRIRKAVKELLKKYSPRDTESTPKFSAKTWERDYEIYRLHHPNYDHRFTFKEIGTKLDVDEPAVKKAYQRIYKHIHQVDEYGTKRTRDELSVDITKGFTGSGNTEGAENQYVRAQMLGGYGAKMAPSGAYEDETRYTYTEIKPEAEAVAFKLCREWPIRTHKCEDDTAKKLGHIGKYAGPIRFPTCKHKPGSRTCSDCTPWRNCDTFTGNLEGTPYFRRRFTEPTEPIGEPLARLIGLLERDCEPIKEDPEQKEYIATNGVSQCPQKVAEGFGPEWDKPIRYWVPEPPCGECTRPCDDSMCDKLWKWTKKNFKPPTELSPDSPHCVSQPSRDLLKNKDEVENALIARIDGQRARKSHH